MHLRILITAIFFPLFSISQLDSLKGKIKFVRDTVIYTEHNYFLLQLRELDFGQFRLSENDIFKDFNGDLLPKQYSQFNKEREFDNKGRITKLKRLYPKINSVYTTNYIYNEFGGLAQTKEEYSGTEHFEVKNYKYRYFGDSNYRISAEVTYGEDPERFSMKQYYYDKKHNIIEKRELSAFGDDYRTNYKYDRSGRLIAELDYNSLKKVFQDAETGFEAISDSSDLRYLIEYDYYPDGSLKKKKSGCEPFLLRIDCCQTLYEYKNKHVSKVYFYQGDSLFSHREYHFNPDNTLKKISWFYKNEPESKNYAEYFYKDKELSKAILTDTGKTTTIEFGYKTDSHNNWIEQTKTVNGKLIYTRKRSITYWD